MAQLNFNAAEVQPIEDFKAIKAGDYEAVITNSVMKPTKSGNGQYLEITFEIIEGEFKGRKFWTRLNLQNPSVKAVEMARRELSTICRAVGVMNPGDSSDLHNIPFILPVKLIKPDPAKGEEFEPYNELGAYRAKEKTAPTAVVSETAAAAQGSSSWNR